MKEWKWQIYSLVVSLVTMAFVYVIVTAPTDYKVTSAVGLVVLLLFLLSNPINRYLKLAIILVSSWLGIVSGTSAKLSLLIFEHGKLNVDFNEIPVYVHVAVLIITLALIVADYRSRERGEDGKPRSWTKNRIEVLKHILRFYSFIAVLVCLLLFTLIVIYAPDGTVETATVRIERTADYSGVNCNNGNINYSAEYSDRLSFSEDVEYYRAQAITSQEGGSHSVRISYFKDGREVSPIPYEDDIIGSSKKKWLKIPVNGKSLQVSYMFSQKLNEDDGEWGPAFRSSLPINGIILSATLPKNKVVSGESKQKKKENSKFAGCEFLTGEHPSLSCESISLKPDTTYAFYWSWDVLDGC